MSLSTVAFSLVYWFGTATVTGATPRRAHAQNARKCVLASLIWSATASPRLICKLVSIAVPNAVACRSRSAYDSVATTSPFATNVTFASFVCFAARMSAPHISLGGSEEGGTSKGGPAQCDDVDVPLASATASLAIVPPCAALPNFSAASLQKITLLNLPALIPALTQQSISICFSAARLQKSALLNLPALIPALTQQSIFNKLLSSESSKHSCAQPPGADPSAY